METWCENKELTNILLNILNTLNERDSKIIKLYFGFYDKTYTQEEISKIVNISRAYVSKIIKNSILKLRKILLNQNLIDVSNKKKIKLLKSSLFSNGVPKRTRTTISPLGGECSILLSYEDKRSASKLYHVFIYKIKII